MIVIGIIIVVLLFVIFWLVLAAVLTLNVAVDVLQRMCDHIRQNTDEVVSLRQAWASYIDWSERYLQEEDDPRRERPS
jgi:hypothetical protein